MVMVATGSLLFAACSSSTTTSTSTTTTTSQPARPISISEAARPSVAEAQGCATSDPASWMSCLVRADPAFGKLPISGLVLPGSDNAGAFNLDPQSFDTQKGSFCTDFVPRDASLGAEFDRWSETQDETITAQLDQGIRFIDLQVAYNGNGSALTGWRVVQSQFSEWPLYDYLDQVAAWAKVHPSEVVIVDFHNVCYDNADSTIAKGLWTNFATPSNVGGGKTTLAQVAFDPSELTGSFAIATVDQVVGEGAGHNVIVLLPKYLEDAKVLTTSYHVKPVFTVASGAGSKASSTIVPVALSNPQVTPTSSSRFAAANATLASSPLRAKPALGSLVGLGLYETQLAYSFNPRAQTSLFATFGGLLQSYVRPATSKVPVTTLPAWEAGLFGASATCAVSRNQILTAWDHRANVVLADGVEYGGYIAAVIALNAK